MKITSSNYESWFLDFLEGNMEPQMAEEFQSFLIMNPDLAEELNLNDALTLMADKTVQFSSKEQLKKLVADKEESFLERVVAYYEGDLSLSEK
jgi:hypothetical protein